MMNVFVELITSDALDEDQLIQSGLIRKLWSGSSASPSSTVNFWNRCRHLP